MRRRERTGRLSSAVVRRSGLDRAKQLHDNVQPSHVRLLHVLRRKRLAHFIGFNSPLLPEILICTSVGQEGIDLHRHCRQVVHYDLAWNPAVLEQRTGRTDRIGSKTFCERARDTDDASAEGPFLEIAVPFLAGTYDERMYEELRLRAQTFEVLTGGDLAADVPEMSD